MRHGTNPAGAGVRTASLTTAALATLLLSGPPAFAADAPRPRPSSWFTNPPPPSRFFTDPPRSSWFTDPPPPSRFFSDPPRPASYANASACRSCVRVERTEPTAYDALIREIAGRYGVEYALVKAMIRAESDFNHLAVSPKGACGLMQLMPSTAASQGVQDVFLPRQNIDGGCRYLRLLLDRYAGNLPLALAAYNAGPERVDVAGGVPRIAETHEYLSRVLQYRLAYRLRGE
jgi:soluble lytic murein transglycosylase-like protein